MTFDRDYQIKLLNLILTSQIEIPVHDYIDSSLFNDEESSLVFRHIKNFENRYGINPNFNFLQKIIFKNLETNGEKKIWFHFFKKLREEVKEPDKRCLLDQLSLWVRTQSLVNSIRKASETLQSTDGELTHEVLDEIQNDFYSSFRRGKVDGANHDYFFDLQDRLANRGIKQIPSIRTLITELDRILLLKGIALGELGFVLAEPNKGKTFFLIHVTKAGVLQNKKVWFITLEMPYDLIAMRMDAAFSGIKINDLFENQAKLFKKINKFSQQYNGNLIISSFPTGRFTVKNMEENLRILKSKDFKPDLVVVDSADLMSSENYFGKDAFALHKEQGDIYQHLKGFGQEHSAAVWTAEWPKDVKDIALLTMEHSGGSKAKPRLADIMISLNQTPDEQKENKMRIYVGKNRNGIMGMIININTNFASGEFYKRVRQ